MIYRQWGVALVVLAVTTLCAGCVRQSVGSTPLAQPPGRSEPDSPPQATTPAASGEISAQPGWFTCQTHADCVQVQTPCGGAQGVNARFANKFAVYSQRLANTLNCGSKPKAARVETKAQCIQTRCNVVPTSGK